MIRTGTLLTIAGALLVTACSSQDKRREPPKMTQIFSTEILSDQTKQFQMVFSREMDERSSQRGRKNGGGQGGGGRGEGSGGRGGERGGDKGERGGRGGENDRQDPEREAKMRAKLIEALDRHIEKTGYCRAGYTLTEERLSMKRGSQVLMGKCNDLANENDLAKFPNPVDPRREVLYESLDFKR